MSAVPPEMSALANVCQWVLIMYLMAKDAKRDGDTLFAGLHTIALIALVAATLIVIALKAAGLLS